MNSCKEWFSNSNCKQAEASFKERGEKLQKTYHFKISALNHFLQHIEHILQDKLI